VALVLGYLLKVCPNMRQVSFLDHKHGVLGDDDAIHPMMAIGEAISSEETVCAIAHVMFNQMRMTKECVRYLNQLATKPYCFPHVYFRGCSWDAGSYADLITAGAPRPVSCDEDDTHADGNGDDGDGGSNARACSSTSYLETLRMDRVTLSDVTTNTIIQSVFASSRSSLRMLGFSGSTVGPRTLHTITTELSLPQEESCQLHYLDFSFCKWLEGLDQPLMKSFLRRASQLKGLNLAHTRLELDEVIELAGAIADIAKRNSSI